MQINIQGHGMELTEPLRDYAIKKVGRMEEFFKNIQRAQIILDFRTPDDTKKAHVAEASLWLAGKKVIRASEAAQDMYAAIDLMVAELEKQVIKHKEKHVKEARRGQEKLKQMSRTYVPAASSSAEPVMVKQTRFDINNMTYEEAQAEAKKMGSEFFLFRNAESGELNILYKADLIDASKVKSFSEEEALKQIKETQAGFLAFLNSRTSELNVLYKRKSGNFGLIEPAL